MSVLDELEAAEQKGSVLDELEATEPKIDPAALTSLAEIEAAEGLPQDNQLESAIKGVGEVLPNVGAGLVKGAASVATAIPWAMTTPISPLGRVVTAINPKIGENIANIPSKLAAMVPGQTPPEILQNEGMNPFKWNRPVRKLSAMAAQNLPGMMIAGAVTKSMSTVDKIFRLGKFPITVTKSGLVGASTLAPQITQDFYAEAVANGMDPNLAAPAALTDGVIATLTEGMILPGIVSQSGHWVKRAIMGALQEGVIEEGVQNTFENGLKILGWDDGRSLVDRLFQGTTESVLTGGLMGGSMGVVFGTRFEPGTREATIARAHKIIEEDGKAKGKTQQEIDAAKTLAQPYIDTLVNDALNTGARYRERVAKNTQDTLKDLNDVSKGYVLTNIMYNDKEHDIKVNATPKVSPDKIKQATKLLPTVLQQVETNLKHPIQTPLSVRDTLINEMALLLDTPGMTEGQVLEKTIEYLTKDKGVKTLYLSGPIKDSEDLGSMVYFLDNMVQETYGTVLTNLFTAGYTPDDIQLRQKVEVHDKNANWPKQAREVANAIYYKGLKDGLWKTPQVVPVSVLEKVAEDKEIDGTQLAGIKEQIDLVKTVGSKELVQPNEILNVKDKQVIDSLLKEGVTPAEIKKELLENREYVFNQETGKAEWRTKDIRNVQLNNEGLSRELAATVETIKEIDEVKLSIPELQANMETAFTEWQDSKEGTSDEAHKKAKYLANYGKYRSAIANMPSLTEPRGEHPGREPEPTGTTPKFGRPEPNRELTFIEQRGWGDNSNRDVELYNDLIKQGYTEKEAAIASRNIIAGSTEWYTGHPEEQRISELYDQIKKLYDSLPDVSPDPSKVLIINQDLEEARTKFKETSEAYAKAYPAVKAAADSINKVIEELRNMGRIQVILEESNDITEEEWNKGLKEQIAKNESAREEKTTEGTKGSNADFADLSNLYSVLSDWATMLRPYVPVRLLGEKAFVPKNIEDLKPSNYLARKLLAKKTFETKISQATAQELWTIQDMFMKEVNEIMSRMTEEQLVELKKRGFSDRIAQLKAESPLSESLDAIDSLLASLSDKMASEQGNLSPWAISEIEKRGGVTFTLDEPVIIDTDKGKVTITGKQNWEKEGELFSFIQDGEVYTASISQLLDNLMVHFDWMEFNCGMPLNKSGWTLFDGLTSFKNFFDYRKYKPDQKQMRSRGMIEVFRWLRRDADALKIYMDLRYGKGMPEAKKQALTQKPVFGPADENIKSLLYKDKLWIDALKSIRSEQMRQVFEEYKDIVEDRVREDIANRKEYLAVQGIVDFNSFHDQVLKKLLMRASEDVVVDENYVVNGKYAMSAKTNSKHLNMQGYVDPIEHKSFLKQAQAFYEVMGFEPTPQQLQNWKDPNGTREPYAWDLLGKWMGNDSLQKWLLFNKADDAAYLNEEIAQGVYTNTDIYTSIREGYQRRVFQESDIQKQGAFSNVYQKTSVGTTNQPKRTIRSYERFIDEGTVDGWTPVDDYFASYRDYGYKALINIHQAMTLAELKGQTMTTFHNREHLRKVSKGTVTVPIILYRHHALVQQEMTRLKKAGIDNISADGVLESWGFLEAKGMPGLVEWHAGAFSVPFVFKPVADLFNAMFDNYRSGKVEGFAIDAMRIMKFIKTANPLDTPSTFAAAALLNFQGTPWKIPFRLVSFLPRILGASARGLLVYGPAIVKGQWNKLPRPTSFGTPNVDKMLLSGCQAVSFQQAMHSFWDKADLGKVPELNTVKDNVWEYSLSLGGINYAIWNDIIGHDIAQIWEEVYTNKKKKGMADWDAAFRTSTFLNNVSFLLNKSIYNREGEWLHLLAFSRGFFVGLSRVGMSMIYGIDQKLHTGIHKTGIFNYHTSQVGKLTNSFLNAELTSRDQKVLAADTWNFMMRMAAVSFISKALLQFILSYRDDDEVDEYGELGSEKGLAARKRWYLLNPPEVWGRAVRLGERDWTGKILYGDTQFFRMMRDLINATTNPMKYITNRSNMFVTSFIALSKNEYPGTNIPIMNQYESNQIKKFLPAVKYLLEEDFSVIGTTSMVGNQEGETGPYRAFELGGGSLVRIDSPDLKEAKRKAGTTAYEDAQATRPMKTTPTEELFKLKDRSVGITGKKLKTIQRTRNNPERMFLRNNRALIRKFRQRHSEEE